MKKQSYDILRKETETLKNTYFEMTKKWAETYFNLVMSRKNWKEVDWCEYFGFTPELKNKGLRGSEFYSFPSGFYNTKKSKEYSRMKDEIRSLEFKGLDKFKEMELKRAELHYESSLLKLASRIEMKGIDINNMKVVSGYVGVNVEMTISDGDKYVKAWTIVAEGTVQRPHYRYLVK